MFPKCDKYKLKINPQYTLRKLVALIQHSIKLPNEQRYQELLEAFLEENNYAFYVQDLPYVIPLMERLVIKIEENGEYEKYLIKMIQLCEKPPLLRKTSEVLDRITDITAFFNMIGTLIVQFETKKIFQSLTCKALRALLERKGTLALNCLSELTVYDAITRSSLCELIGHLLEIVDEDTFTILLEIVIILSNRSEALCFRFLKADLLNSTIVRLEPTWRERIPITRPPKPTFEMELCHIEIICEVLDIFVHYLIQNPAIASQIRPPKQFSLWSLRYGLRLLVINKLKRVYRDHLLVLLINFCYFFPKIEFVNSGLATDLMKLSNSSEVNRSCPWAENFKFADHDFEFKKMLLLIMPFYIRNQAGIRILEDEMVIYALIKLISGKHLTQWNVTIQRRLAVCALEVLKVVGPYLMGDYVEYNGNSELTGLIAKYFEDDPRTDEDLFEACLSTICSFTKPKHSHAIKWLVINDGKNFFYGVAAQLLEAKQLSVRKQSCLSYTFCILDRILETYGSAGPYIIDICIKFLKRKLEPAEEDPVQNPNVCVTAVSLLWTCLLCSEIDMNYFVEKGGTYLLLDLIESTSFPVKVITLGMLVDLCDNGSCIPYIITWRKNGKTIIPLLLDLFREENKRIGVESGPFGEIKDYEFPLMGKQQKLETLCICERFFTNPSISDLIGSVRPKSFAILQLLTVRHAEKVEIANDIYKLLSEELSYEDQITKLIAENYLAFKIGEQWEELRIYFDKIGVSLAALDNSIVSILTHRIYKWGFHLKESQEAVLRRRLEMETIKEKELYRALRETKLSASLKALHELSYIARCTEKMYRMSQKIIQHNQVEQSLMFDPDPKVHAHRTFIYVPVTPIFNQEVSVITETSVTPDIEITYVSPCTSEIKIDSYDKEEQNQDSCSKCNMFE